MHVKGRCSQEGCGEGPFVDSRQSGKLQGVQIMDTYQVIQSDLLIPQLEVTYSPLKGHLTIPKRSRIESPGMKTHGFQPQKMRASKFGISSSRGPPFFSGVPAV